MIMRNAVKGKNLAGSNLVFAHGIRIRGDSFRNCLLLDQLNPAVFGPPFLAVIGSHRGIRAIPEGL
jgi:hypothetical protein